MQFTDKFSKQSSIYARYRPGYPTELFQYLSTLCPAHNLAWDCGTGNGQSALSLVNYFQAVYATDPSAEQIAQAPQHPAISYKVEEAESSGLADNSVDLITIAQALHWFRFGEFYNEAKRVLKPSGIIAAWAYGLPSISPEIDEIVRHFHDDTLDTYWLYENRLIDGGYNKIPFPFQRIAAPEFNMQKDFSLPDLLGLLRTWSAVQSFINTNGYDPVSELEPDLLSAWQNPGEEKTLTWKLILLLGRQE